MLVFALSTLSALFTCDSLTPDLCALNVEEASVTVRGLQLRYWEYVAAEPKGRVEAADAEAAKLPIIMVHGGPGWAHDYMLPLKQQACRGRRTIFYDQVGAGRSERPAMANVSAPHLFDLAYYPEELASLAGHLGLTRFHDLGSS